MHIYPFNELERYRIRGTPLDSFTNYFRNVTDFIELNELKSNQQFYGSTTGLSWNYCCVFIYINDFCSPIASNALRG